MVRGLQWAGGRLRGVGGGGHGLGARAPVSLALRPLMPPTRDASGHPLGGRGNRIEVARLQGYDVTHGAFFLGESWTHDSLFHIYTANAQAAKWPYSTYANYWESPAVIGFQFYDTFTTSLLSNVTFKNYKFRQLTTNPSDWWYDWGPMVIRDMTHSDTYKPGARGVGASAACGSADLASRPARPTPAPKTHTPTHPPARPPTTDKTMEVTKGIKVVDTDLGTCTGTGAATVCWGTAFFNASRSYTGSAWMFNWLGGCGEGGERGWGCGGQERQAEDARACASARALGVPQRWLAPPHTRRCGRQRGAYRQRLQARGPLPHRLQAELVEPQPRHLLAGGARTCLCVRARQCQQCRAHVALARSTPPTTPAHNPSLPAPLPPPPPPPPAAEV